MRIGILTFHRAYNCGAMLQAWALKRTLEEMGHTADFPACNLVGAGHRWKARSNPQRRGALRVASMAGAFLKNALSVPVEDLARRRYRRFREKHLAERECRPAEFPALYDAMVVGSDQVWNEARAGAYWPLFLGENWGAGIPAVAYGASWGDALPSPEQMARLKRALGRFAGVSVREDYAREDLSRAGADAGGVAVVADPTLLRDWREYAELARGVEHPRGRYLFMYNVMLETQVAWRLATAAAKALGVQAVVASVYQYTRWGAPPGLAWGMSPERLAAYTERAEYVLACSFHGTAMGLLSGKPTLSVLPGPDNGRSRSGGLLRSIGEGWRLATAATPAGELAGRFGRGGASADAMARLSKLRRSSTAWLEGQLGTLERGLPR